MITIPNPPVFDGHNDLLLRLWLHDAADPAAQFLDGALEGHLDLRRCRLGGFAGGLFAIFVPPASYMPQLKPNSPPEPHDALAITQAQISLLERLETQSSGRAKICRTVAEIEHCIAHGVLAMVMHIEGAERWAMTIHGWKSGMKKGCAASGRCGIYPISLVLESKVIFRVRRIPVMA